MSIVKGSSSTCLDTIDAKNENEYSLRWLKKASLRDTHIKKHRFYDGFKLHLLFETQEPLLQFRSFDLLTQ